MRCESGYSRRICIVRAVPLTRGGPNVRQLSGPLESDDPFSSVPAKLDYSYPATYQREYFFCRITSDKDHFASREVFWKGMECVKCWQEARSSSAKLLLRPIRFPGTAESRGNRRGCYARFSREM